MPDLPTRSHDCSPPQPLHATADDKTWHDPRQGQCVASLTASSTDATLLPLWPIATDAKLRLVSCTDAAAAMLGFEAAELKSKLLLASLAPEGVPPSGDLDFEALRSLLITTQPVHGKVIRVNAGSGYRTWTVHARPHHSPAGRFRGFLVSLADTDVAESAHPRPSAQLPARHVLEIEAQLEAAVDDASRDGALAAALFIIEWDNAGQGQSDCGAGVRDEAQHEIAARIREVHRYAIICHMHHKRIVCLVPAVPDALGAARVGRLLLDGIATLLSGWAGGPTIAVGGAHTATGDGALQTLLDHAEAALIEVEFAGTPMVIHSPGMQLSASADQLSRRVERALSSKATSLRYSAIHDLTTHAITGLIARVQWADAMLSSLSIETIAGFMAPAQIETLSALLLDGMQTILNDLRRDLTVFLPAILAPSSMSTALLDQRTSLRRVGFIATTQAKNRQTEALCKAAMARHPIMITHELAGLEPVLALISTDVLAAAYGGNSIVPAPEDQSGKLVATGVGTLTAAKDVGNAGYARFCGLKATSDLPATKIIEAIALFTPASISNED